MSPLGPSYCIWTCKSRASRMVEIWNIRTYTVIYSEFWNDFWERKECVTEPSKWWKNPAYEVARESNGGRLTLCILVRIRTFIRLAEVVYGLQLCKIIEGGNPVRGPMCISPDLRQAWPPNEQTGQSVLWRYQEAGLFSGPKYIHKAREGQWKTHDSRTTLFSEAKLKTNTKVSRCLQLRVMVSSHLWWEC